MADRPGLIAALHSRLSTGTRLIDIERARSWVSSPRLLDVKVRNLATDKLRVVGDTFLDQRTMLADAPQRTFGISLENWKEVESQVELVEVYSFNDASVAGVQIWPFDPCLLDEHQTRLAVALSYTSLELYAEPRIIGALNDILEEIGFFIDADRY